MAAQTATRTHNEYTVGWVCALSKEQTAATAMLDDRHGSLPKPPNDPNTYILGSIGKHNIVIACLPEGEIGTNSAATTATWMISTFPSIKFGLMVGIGGGIPPKVRLGDVVVSIPVDRYPGVVQWDYGKAEKGGEFKQTGLLNNPPTLLRTALTENELSGSKIPEYLDDLRQKWPRLVLLNYTWSESLTDRRQKATLLVIFFNGFLYLLQLLFGFWAIGPIDREVKGEASPPAVNGDERKPRDTRIHYGLIASGSQVIKDAKAAGLMNNFPCIVIRGICDYADSQKNKNWQEYAAAVAAAFAKELLQNVQPIHDDVTHIRSKLDGKDNTEILDWLTRTDYGPQQSDNLNRRQPETGIWFLESVEFQDWLITSKQSLLCLGIPGAGKTILTSIVVDYLSLKFNNDSNTGIAYIYCNFKQQEEQKIYNLLASVLKQLVKSQPYLPESPSLNEILTVLQSVTMMYSRIFIIVDALDKCQEYNGYQERFISELSNLQLKNRANIFVTSKIIPDIKKKFKGSKEVEIRAHDKDKLLQKYQKKIKTEITKVVGDTLANLPTRQRAYDCAYKKPMQRINSHNANSKELALLVLGTELNKKNLVLVENIVSDCAGLVTVNKKRNIIQLVHYTTQEYFERTQEQWFPTAHTQITTIYITYLSFKTFKTGYCRGHHAPKDEVSQELSRFLESKVKVEASSQALMATEGYFSNYSQEVPRKMTGLHLAAIFGLSKAIDTLIDLGHSPNADDSWNKDPLWYAVRNKHEAIVKQLLARGANVNGTGKLSRVALQVAAGNGHLEIVEMLLAAGARVNVDAQRHSKPTALQLAAKNGHQEMVKMLLAAGADVNAAYEIVKMLLAAGTHQQLEIT
ncbi:hypothetical protein GGI43DRAFT_422907 [Trichoderma evansii]